MRRTVAAALLAVAGCAHGAASGGAEEAIATAPVFKPHRLLRGSDGAPLSEAEWRQHVQAARVVLFGERHDSAEDHGAEIELLTAVHAVEPRVAVGFEMVPASLQPQLDAYAAGLSDEPTFLSAVDWERTWGFPWGLYRPLFAFAQTHRLGMYALNAPRELTRAVSKDGLEGLSAAQRAQLPELVPGPAAHRELAREAFGVHAHSRFTDARFERFYAVQLVWDETMAAHAVEALARRPDVAKLVVFAGEGHTRPFAIPARVLRRGQGPTLTVVGVDAADVPDAVAGRVADVLWVWADAAPGEARK